MCLVGLFIFRLKLSLGEANNYIISYLHEVWSDTPMIVYIHQFWSVQKFHCWLTWLELELPYHKVSVDKEIQRWYLARLVFLTNPSHTLLWNPRCQIFWIPVLFFLFCPKLQHSSNQHHLDTALDDWDSVVLTGDCELWCQYCHSLKRSNYKPAMSKCCSIKILSIFEGFHSHKLLTVHTKLSFPDIRALLLCIILTYRWTVVALAYTLCFFFFGAYIFHQGLTFYI